MLASPVSQLGESELSTCLQRQPHMSLKKLWIKTLLIFFKVTAQLVPNKVYTKESCDIILLLQKLWVDEPTQHQNVFIHAAKWMWKSMS